MEDLALPLHRPGPGRIRPGRSAGSLRPRRGPSSSRQSNVLPFFSGRIRHTSFLSQLLKREAFYHCWSLGEMSLSLLCFYSLDRGKGSFPSAPSRCWQASWARQTEQLPGPCPHPGSTPASPGAEPRRTPSKTLPRLFRKPCRRCEIPACKKPRQSKKQQTQLTAATGALPSPTCSPVSGGCNYIFQCFLNVRFFFPPPSSWLLRNRSNQREETKARRWQSFRHAQLF